MPVLLLNQGWQPSQIAFCTDERSWKRFLRQNKFESDYKWNEAMATTHHFTSPKGHIIVVCLNDDFEKQCGSGFEVMGVLCHESVHVFQYVCDFMGEEDPSPEFMAYSIQNIFQELLAVWWDFRGSKQ